MTRCHPGQTPSIGNIHKASTPLVSILIPAYNVERYVAAAIESALAQTYPTIEIVVVDDGSTDDTATVIAAFHDDRIVNVRQANRGLAGARNAALGAASGHIVGLLDADDVWEPSRVQRCVDYLTSHPRVGVVTTDAFLLAEDTLTTRRYYGDFFTGDFPSADRQLDAIARGNFVFVGALLRRSLLERVGLFDESLRRAEDFDLWSRLLLDGVEFGLVAEPLAQYRVRADSLSADAAAQWEAHLTVLDKHLLELVRRGVRPDTTVAYDLARRHEGQGRRRLASRYYALAARGLPRPSPRERVKLRAAAVRAFVRSVAVPTAGP